ncbi:enoyl-CoA hydratase/isomerase family protein [Bartonella sp. F02]|uniref:enoyl-CoA hydratase/isomerase family protein n=1 Tax=Bartonella sp. F02 TaxID=2967262 RepID=UPI0022A946D1|nr:enoyl-CoA hydratase/isomerase family protein [Bartonella sp. F02]MCZ2328260.1 enoyl-CoA hydratase/isomerase family protein [Bartonella sp. F02]
MQIDFGAGDDISFIKEGRAGIIQLTRPSALNALNHKMVLAFRKALNAWENDNDIACILIEGKGRAFCAGGDIVEIYHKGKVESTYQYFRDQYCLSAYIKRFPKPYISFLNGIWMGGGVGISIHGSYRIVTENTLFAMPESAIGFFPDVGASFFLPSLPNHFGIYLALTGTRIKWGDCLKLGLATHAIPESEWDMIKKAIIEQGNPILALEKQAIERDYETSDESRRIIKDCFGVQTLEECIKSLYKKSSEGSLFAKECYDILQLRSPTSLKVIWRQMKQNSCQTLEEYIKVENRIAHHMINDHDFYEGIRAILIDKDQTPKWNPDQLSNITDEMIETYFQPVERELLF